MSKEVRPTEPDEMVLPVSEAEPLISFSQAARMCGCSPGTINAWTKPDKSGRYLESSTIRGRRFTSREALRRFFAEDNGLRLPRVDTSSSESLYHDFPNTRPKTN